MDDFVSWAKGDYPDYCGGGGGHRALKALGVGVGVEPGRGLKDTALNVKKFRRESKLMTDPDGEYAPPQLCGKTHFKE